MATVYILCLLSFLHGCWCLDLQLSAPSVVATGDNLTFVCSYNTQNATLLSLILLFGDTMFYSYIPADPIRGTAHGNTELRSFILYDCVDSCVKIALRNVTKDLTGNYRCEANATYGNEHYLTYQRKTAYAYVIVSERPKEDPIVTTDQEGYAVGEDVNAKCISKDGFPPANLTWFVNGIEIDSSNTFVLKQHVEIGAHNTNNSVSELQLLVNPSMTDDNSTLRLSCAATQYDFYKSTTDLVLSPNGGSGIWSRSSRWMLMAAVSVVMIANLS